jgi:penicillin-binding protein 2
MFDAKRFWIGALISLALAACNNAPTQTPTPSTPEATAVPTVAPSPTPPPDPKSTTEAYLSAWQAGDYAAMYAWLAGESRAALSAADFEQTYRDLLDTMAIRSLSAEVTDVSEEGGVAQATAHLRYDSVLVGAFETDVVIPLKPEGGGWRIIFDRTLIWPELVNGQYLLMVPLLPERGSIYDRNGAPLAVYTDAVAIGVVPGELGEDSAAPAGLARLLDTPARNIVARYEFAPFDQYFAMAEASAEEFQPVRYLQDLPGVYVTPYTGRYYAGNGAAAHVTGYTAFIQPEQLAEYRARGYAGSERVGATGLEAWGESYLAGKNGGQLQLRDANNQFVRMVASRPFAPSQDLYATIDFEMQQAARFALGDLTGAIVVLHRDTGEVLALASAPSFSPNLFDVNNRNAPFLNNILSDARRPLINHAAQSAYPAGSVFKLITMAAGLNSNLFTPEMEYTCTGEWDEINDPTFAPRKDWKEGGHGTLTFSQGLSGSCNPWFWHVGYALFQWDPSWLSKTAREFGLGAPAGMGQVDETPGQIPDPEWKRQTRGEAWSAIDSLNLSIGQGDVLVTPMQMARVAAAMGNGGTLYQLQLVQEVRPPEAGAAPSFVFQPAPQGTLPLTPEQLAAMQTAMYNVTQEPIGTARNRFRGLPSWLKIAGKTGTAEDPGLFGEQEPNAWFIGYTFANRPDRPDIAVAVVVQNQGQGSDYAAPIFRRVIEAYFGLPYRLYPWEEAIGVTAAPTPTPGPEVPTETPTPGP